MSENVEKSKDKATEQGNKKCVCGAFRKGAFLESRAENRSVCRNNKEKNKADNGREQTANNPCFYKMREGQAEH